MTEHVWTPADLPEFTGETVIITGANSGIGYSAAKALAGRGAHVVLAVRNAMKGMDAAASIAGSVEVRQLDLADLASVHEFVRDWDGDIRLLINNAGVMAPPLTRTADGFELQFGTNHLGHFALTNLLLPHVTGRVVNVSSLAHNMGKISYDDPNWNRRRYSRWEAYGQSKLANLLFTLELQRRLTRDGSPVITTVAHPGLAATNLMARSPIELVNTIASGLTKVVAQTPDEGAQPTLFAATADIPGTTFVGPSGTGQVKGPPEIVEPSAKARDALTAQRLWAMSTELTGVKYPN